jgi:hypothetical protein
MFVFTENVPTYNSQYITAGKKYLLKNIRNGGGDITTDLGVDTFIHIKNSSHLAGGEWGITEVWGE